MLRRDLAKRTLLLIAISLAMGICLIAVGFMGGPIEGYYRSLAATCLDGESKGYLRFSMGQVYVVNTRRGKVDCFRLGHYARAGWKGVVLYDEINGHLSQGAVTLREYLGRARAILTASRGAQCSSRFLIAQFVTRKNETCV